MISVIIPTMWRSDKTIGLLAALQTSRHIGEIIIIDNDVNARNIDLTRFTKVRHFPQESNIFVNPAWNLGVKYAKHEILCICNDDINFNVEDVCSTVLKHQERLGIFGASIDSGRNNQKPDVICLDNLALRKAWIVAYGFGMLMFLKKSRWIDIPEELKIYYGDNWISEVHSPAYAIEYKTEIKADKHTTCMSDDIRPLLMEDRKTWKSLISKYKRF